MNTSKAAAAAAASATASPLLTTASYEPPCPFCHIARTNPPVDPFHPAFNAPPPFAATELPPSFVLLSTPTLIAFLDILPLSRGHVLLCPRTHRAKLTDATPRECAALGRGLRVVSAALTRATGVADWNVVQNNGAAAAQVVRHVHFHVIPRPEIRAGGRDSESFTMFGRGMREELDEDDAAVLVRRLRECVAEVLREEEVVVEQEKERGQRRNERGNAKL